MAESCPDLVSMDLLEELQARVAAELLPLVRCASPRACAPPSSLTSPPAARASPHLKSCPPCSAPASWTRCGGCLLVAARRCSLATQADFTTLWAPLCARRKVPPGEFTAALAAAIQARRPIPRQPSARAHSARSGEARRRSLRHPLAEGRVGRGAVPQPDAEPGAGLPPGAAVRGGRERAPHPALTPLSARWSGWARATGTRRGGRARRSSWSTRAATQTRRFTLATCAT